MHAQLLDTWGAETFHFHDAVYFTIITITTVGYGDYYPVSTVGILFCIRVDRSQEQGAHGVDRVYVKRMY